MTPEQLLEDVARAILETKTPECREGAQYVLIRGLSAIGFSLPANESLYLVDAIARAALAVAIEACAKVAANEQSGLGAGLAILALKPKD